MKTVSRRGRERVQAGRGLCITELSARLPQRHGGPECAETHDLLGDGGALKSQDDVCVRGMAGPLTLWANCAIGVRQKDAQVCPGSSSSVNRLPSSLT